MMVNQKENFAELIVKSLSEVSEKESICYKLENGKKISFKAQDVINEIEKTAELLLSIGLKRGDRILSFSKVSPYYLISILAAIKVGIVPMLIDFSITTEELEEILHVGEVKTVITTKDLMFKIPKNYHEMIPAIDISQGIELSSDFSKKVSKKFKDTSNVHPEVAFILFSSGTTSKRKGVEITHKSQRLVLNDALPRIQIKEYNCDMISVLPFSHIAGLTTALAPLYKKSTLYMVENINTLKIAYYLQEFDTQYIVLIPKIYEAFMIKTQESIKSKGKFASNFIFKLMEFNLSMRKKYNINFGKLLFGSIRKKLFGPRLECMAAGGTALSSKILDFYASLGYTLVNVYASTETSVNTICTDVENYDSSETGKPISNYIETKIINCDKFGVGELAIKSPCLFYGYFKDDKTTKESYTEDGYFKTGDLARISSAGGITIEGRRKEAILLSNGEKVSPESIESSYVKIMKGLSFAVCGVQLRESTEYDTVFMFIEGKLSEKDKANIKQNLFFENGSINQNYRVSQVRFIEKLPRTGVGKIKRFCLKDIILNEINSEVSCEQSHKDVYQEDDTEEGRINTLIRKNSKLDLGSINILPEMNLYNDLAYDSLSLFQLSIDIENEFKQNVSKYFTADLTVQDLYDILKKDFYKEIKLEYDYDINDYPQSRSDSDERVFKFLAGIFKRLYKTEYIGKENIPKDIPVIFCPNHISELDPLVLCFGLSTEYRKNLYCICWDKFTATKKGRYFMKLLNAIPIDRRSIGNSTTTLRVGNKYLNKKSNLIIFPEGTRTYDGELGTFQDGAACIAKSSSSPIIPVTLIGMYDAFAKTEKIYRLRKNGNPIKIKVIFGKPIYGNELSVKELTNKVKQSINETLHS